MTGSKYAARQSVVYLFIIRERQWMERHVPFGGYSEKVTPVPIPNTVVKLLCADNTGRATAWELKSLPEFSLLLLWEGFFLFLQLFHNFSVVILLLDFLFYDGHTAAFFPSFLLGRLQFISVLWDSNP